MPIIGVDLAWAIGLFEGEGSIHLTKRKTKGGYRYALCVTSTDQDVLQKLQAVWGLGRISGPYRQGGWKPYYKDAYRWQASSAQDVASVLMTMYPMLCERRKAKARELLLVWRSCSPVRGRHRREVI